jgi:hypothetical protein
MKWYQEDDEIADQALREGLTAPQIADRINLRNGSTISARAVQERFRTRGIRAEYVREMAARERAGRAPTHAPPQRPPLTKTQSLTNQSRVRIEAGPPSVPLSAEREAVVDSALDAEASPVERSAGGYVPHPPRGPSANPFIPDGHELHGVSTLTNEQGAITGQWNKTRTAGAENPPVPIPESFLLDKASVMRRGDGSTVVEWSSYKQDAIEKWEAIKEAVSDHIATYVRPAPPVDGPSSTDADLLVAYPLGDPHIGMLAWGDEVGESFDLKMAERELCECMSQLVARSPAAEEAIVCNLGDFWHAQDDNQRTPKSGHKLDVDGRHGKVARVGLAIFRTLVDTALTKHRRVRVRSIPGNHDPHSSFWLPEYIRATYMEEPRVIVEDGFNPYQYDTFGRVLLGWAHGDGAKLDRLGELMAADVPEKWGAAKFRYWNTGHVHHWSQKELPGCVVDTHRTLAGRDAWTHLSGYRSGRALKGICYHRDYGLDSTVIVGIERVRAALLSAA